MMAAMILAALLSLPAGDISAECRSLVAEQDALVKDLDAQIAELKLALASRTSEAETRKLEAAVLAETAQRYRELWLAEAERGAADRKRAFWADKFQAMKWGVAGAAAGVLVERFAE